MSELEKKPEDLKKLSIDELKEHVKELETAGYDINYKAVKTLMSKETEDKEKRSVARKQIRQAYENPPKKSSSASEEKDSAELERYAELNKKAKRSKSGEDDLYHIANSLQVAGRSTLNKEALIWAIIEKEKKLEKGEEKVSTKVRKNAASPSLSVKIPAGAITESEPKKKSPKKSTKISSPKSSPAASPKSSPRQLQKSATKSATKSASASGSKSKSSSGGDADDPNYCGQKNDFACPPTKVCSADARMCIPEKIGLRSPANVLFKGHKVVGSKEAIAKLKGVMARKCGSESYDALTAKSLEEIKKKLKAKGIDAEGVTTKEKAIDLLCEYSIHSKTCDAKGNFGCPDGTVCNISSKPGICVSYDSAENFLESKETSTLKYKGHNIIGSKSAIEALKKQLEKIKPAAKPIAKPVTKETAKKPRKITKQQLVDVLVVLTGDDAENFERQDFDSLMEVYENISQNHYAKTREQLIHVLSILTGTHEDYFQDSDKNTLIEIYENIIEGHANRKKMIEKLAALSGERKSMYKDWDFEDIENEIYKLENGEEVEIEEKYEEDEEKEEEPIVKPAKKSASLSQKMKAMAEQDEEEEEEEKAPVLWHKTKNINTKATPLPKPAAKEKPEKKEKPKAKPKPESKSAEESDEEKNEVSAKVQKIIKNIKAGKKADDGTEISQWQQAVIKCLGLGA